jgi:hypothetical protein
MATKKIAELHDANLLSIKLGNCKTEVRMTFESANFQEITLTLFDVKLMRVVDFWQGNIVSRAIFYSGADLNHSEMLSQIEWASSSTNSGPISPDKDNQAFLTEVLSGKLEIFYLDPTSGAEAVIVCEHHQIDIQPSEFGLR